MLSAGKAVELSLGWAAEGGSPYIRLLHKTLDSPRGCPYVVRY